MSPTEIRTSHPQTIPAIGDLPSILRAVRS